MDSIDLFEVIQKLNQAAEALALAAHSARSGPFTKPMGVRLGKMSREAREYSLYIATYFSAGPKARSLS